MFTPRPYQALAIDDCKKHLKKTKRKGICVVSGAGGKSVIIAKLGEWVASFDNYRCLVVTHRKELLQQNISKINHKSVGLVSAGLNRFEYEADIVVGGIQTIYNKQKLLGKIDLILIDECQKLSNNPQDNSMYWQLLNSYPNARVLGFTALPHRLKDGLLTWGDTCHITTYEHLLEEGYVTRLSNKVLYKPDLSEVKKQAKDYVMQDYAEKKMSGKFIENSAARAYQIFKKHNLKKALVFAPTVEHANILTFALHDAGFKTWAKDGQTAVLHGGLSKAERDDVLKRHREGEFNCLVNVEILTEGYDDSEIDLLICLRPTMSLSLWQQILYRVCRLVDPSIGQLPTKEKRLKAIAESSKPVAYVLDFAGNLKQHGGLVDTSWQYLDGKIQPVRKTLGKVCPACEELIPIASTKCPECGYVPTKEEIEKQWEEEFDDETDINEKKSPIKWYKVHDVVYEPDWISSKGNKMLKVVYQCGIYKIYEFVFNNKKAKWLRDRGYSGRGYIPWDDLKKPTKLQVNTAGKYPKILNYSWGNE